ncbi:hypothetical protein HY032_03320, partial [Candidatus Gottesmanbacteria bacterium]|nr:hypothetical protein [Candidatus Gottesmanbacteria bacterium]
MRKKLSPLLIFLLFFFFSFWLMFHTFSYDPNTHTILIARKLWSDFGAHIPLIRSFSMGDNFNLLRQGKPQYPLYPGEKMRYHFVFYALVGLLERVGLPLDWALNLPSILGFFTLLLFLFLIARMLFKDVRVAILSIIFFLFNGSLAFLQFFRDHPLSRATFTDILHVSEFPAFAPWGPGDVSAFWNLNIYTNQRHLAVGFAIALGFILTVLHIDKNISFAKATGLAKLKLQWAILWGVVIGLLPYLHTPTLVIMAVLFISYFLLFGNVRRFLLVSGAIAGILVIPQLLSFPQGPTSIRWYPGYLIHDELTLPRFLLYWWQNLGLHSILIPIGFIFIPSRAKKTLLPVVPIFLIGNLFQFSVEVAANHKFFNFALILGNMVSAYTIVSIGKHLHLSLLRVKSRNLFLFFIGSIGNIGSICLLVVLLSLSGIIDFFVVWNDQKGGIADVGNSDVATWIARNTPTNAVFLNSSFLYPPANLAGRKIFLGWPYFAWSAGYQGNRHETMKTIYESKDSSIFCPLLKSNSIDYVTVENTEGDPNLPAIDVAYFLKNYS